MILRSSSRLIPSRLLYSSSSLSLPTSFPHRCFHRSSVSLTPSTPTPSSSAPSGNTSSSTDRHPFFALIFRKFRWYHYLFGGISYVGGGLILTWLYQDYYKDPISNYSLYPDDNARKAVYEKIAKKYDNILDSDEKWIGIGSMRAKIVEEYSRGAMLELGVGTGRNLNFVPCCGTESIKNNKNNNKEKEGETCVTSYDGMDQSRAMVEQSQNKLISLIRSKQWPSTVPARLHVCDAHQLPFENNRFDTVLDTFGLCSYGDPISVLKEMSRVCKSDGQILLLQHGRVHFSSEEKNKINGDYWWKYPSLLFKSWMNNYLDRGVVRHATKFGCEWNKDIEDIIQKSDLEIIKIERKWMGTTQLIICKPKKSLQ